MFLCENFHVLYILRYRFCLFVLNINADSWKNIPQFINTSEQNETTKGSLLCLTSKARDHIIHVHIRYAENNSNLVKTQCLLIPLNVPVLPATKRSKSKFRAMITMAHGSWKWILWQDYVSLTADSATWVLYHAARCRLMVQKWSRLTHVSLWSLRDVVRHGCHQFHGFQLSDNIWDRGYIWF